MTRAIAIDPGKESAAIACVEWSGKRGALPKLIRGAEVFGKWPALWGTRAKFAVASFADVIEDSRLYLERMPPTSRGKNPADLSMPAEAGGRIGEQFSIQYGVYPKHIRPRAWWALVGVGRKRGNGEHRIKEAIMRCEGAEYRLDTIPKTRRVDMAEAILIATACCYIREEG